MKGEGGGKVSGRVKGEGMGRWREGKKKVVGEGKGKGSGHEN